mmetsp:Transcript_10379/g.40375  ORF Transcript_10379/g.40375 Transcript_10379/m.40375 type:complete len:642 (+) Transcript_10379:1872-3797(+)
MSPRTLSRRVVSSSRGVSARRTNTPGVPPAMTRARVDGLGVALRLNSPTAHDGRRSVIDGLVMDALTPASDSSCSAAGEAAAADVAAPASMPPPAPALALGVTPPRLPRKDASHSSTSASTAPSATSLASLPGSRETAASTPAKWAPTTGSDPAASAAFISSSSDPKPVPAAAVELPPTPPLPARAAAARASGAALMSGPRPPLAGFRRLCAAAVAAAAEADDDGRTAPAAGASGLTRRPRGRRAPLRTSITRSCSSSPAARGWATSDAAPSGGAPGGAVGRKPPAAADVAAVLAEPGGDGDKLSSIAAALRCPGLGRAPAPAPATAPAGPLAGPPSPSSSSPWAASSTLITERTPPSRTSTLCASLSVASRCSVTAQQRWVVRSVLSASRCSAQMTPSPSTLTRASDDASRLWSDWMQRAWVMGSWVRSRAATMRAGTTSASTRRISRPETWLRLQMTATASRRAESTLELSIRTSVSRRFRRCSMDAATPSKRERERIAPTTWPRMASPSLPNLQRALSASSTPMPRNSSAAAASVASLPASRTPSSAHTMVERASAHWVRASNAVATSARTRSSVAASITSVWSTTGADLARDPTRPRLARDRAAGSEDVRPSPWTDRPESRLELLPARLPPPWDTDE